MSLWSNTPRLGQRAFTSGGGFMLLFVFVEFIDFCVRVHVRLARRSWVVRLHLFLQSSRC